MKYERRDKSIDPEAYGYPSKIRNNLIVPPGVIAEIVWPDHMPFKRGIVKSLRGVKHRDWFSQHAYFCLPLVVANQVGYVITAPYDFQLYWNGGESKADAIVTCLAEKEEDRELFAQMVSIESHFGSGIITVNPAVQFRTPRGVNMFVGAPPNYFIDGISWLSAMVETDNLRRNFTFNFRITRSHQNIVIRRGQPIGWMMPYPRYYADSFSYMASETLPFSEEDLVAEHQTEQLFAHERTDIDIKRPGANGYRYRDGVDVFDTPFEDHQTKILDHEVARERLATLRHTAFPAPCSDTIEDEGV